LKINPRDFQFRRAHHRRCRRQPARSSLYPDHRGRP